MIPHGGHTARYRGVRYVTVVCACGWVSENHPSRGEAKRAHDGHVWLAEHRNRRGSYGTVGVDARRRPQC